MKWLNRNAVERTDHGEHAEKTGQPEAADVGDAAQSSARGRGEADQQSAIGEDSILYMCMCACISGRE